jgi:hypothetical protein
MLSLTPHAIIGGLSAILAGFLTNLAVKFGWSRARRAVVTMLLAAGFIVIGELGWLGLRAVL